MKISKIIIALVLALLIFAGLFIYFRHHDRAIESNGPNVLFITLDTTRRDHLSAYGYGRNTTPNIDEVAKESALFTNALSVIPLTTPSHVTIFTGLHPATHLIYRNSMPFEGRGFTLLAKLLKDAGYTTGAFVSAVVVKAKIGFGEGFDHYSEFKRDNDKSKKPRPSVMRPANETVDDAMEWLENKFDERFFMWVHLYDPHLPYDPPLKYGRMFNPEYMRSPDKAHPEDLPDDLNHDSDRGDSKKGRLRMHFPRKIGSELVRQMKDAYDGEIAFCDDELGRIFSFLKEKGIYDNTIIVIMGDHGEMLYEKEDYFGHHKFLYQGSLEIPLIMRFPNIVANRVDAAITNVDVMPTLLGALNIKNDAKMDGKSFWPAIARNDSIKKKRMEIILTNAGPARPNKDRFDSSRRSHEPGDGFTFEDAFDKIAAIEDGLKIIMNNRVGTLELYDLNKDPYEMKDLFGMAEYEPLFKGMAGNLMDYLREKRNIVISKERSKFNRRDRDALKSLGYMQ